MAPERRPPEAAAAPDPLEPALAERGLRDPRAYYREILKRLKAKDGEAYRAAVAYHDERLKAAMADDVDPVEEWLEYGRYLAELLAPGRTWTVDGTGLAEPYRRPPPRGALVLHLPEGAGERGLVLSAPRRLTAPQRAAFDLLAR